MSKNYKSMSKWLIICVTLLAVCKNTMSLKLEIPDFADRMSECFLNWDQLYNDRPKFEKKGQVTENVLKLVREILHVLGIDGEAVQIGMNEQISLSEYIFYTYRRVPYHNICHGISVAYYTAKFLEKTGQNIKFDKYAEENKISLVLAGLMHDIGHSGFTNAACESVLPHLSVIEEIKKSEKNPFCAIKKQFVDDEKKIQHSETCDENAEYFLPNQGVFEDHGRYKITFDQVKESFDTYFTQNEKTEKKTFHETFCGSAELQHAMITYQVFSMISQDKKLNSQLAVASILATNMKAYQFGSGLPYFVPKEDAIGSELLEIVHIADIIGAADFNKKLRGIMAQRLMYEFREEVDYLKGNSFLKTQVDTFQNFLKGQMGFLNGMVLPQVKSIDPKGELQNSELKSYLANIEKVTLEMTNALNLAGSLEKHEIENMINQYALKKASKSVKIHEQNEKSQVSKIQFSKNTKDEKSSQDNFSKLLKKNPQQKSQMSKKIISSIKKSEQNQSKIVSKVIDSKTSLDLKAKNIVSQKHLINKNSIGTKLDIKKKDLNHKISRSSSKKIIESSISKQNQNQPQNSEEDYQMENLKFYFLVFTQGVSVDQEKFHLI